MQISHKYRSHGAKVFVRISTDSKPGIRRPSIFPTPEESRRLTMSRVHVIGSYVGKSFVLRYAEGPRAGEVFLQINPNDIVRPGSSIGGYWAKPITLTVNEYRLALVRVSGAYVDADVQTLRREFGRERGEVLHPRPGLWATSSKSAKRGVFHRISDETDPIKIALHGVGAPSNVLNEVSYINEIVHEGGALCEHTASSGVSATHLRYDGKLVILREAPREKHEEDELSWCPTEAREVQITGGSYLMRLELRSGHQPRQRDPFVDTIWITPEADRRQVADLIAEWIFGTGADLEFLEALRNPAKARAWVESRPAMQEWWHAIPCGYNREHQGDRARRKDHPLICLFIPRGEEGVVRELVWRHSHTFLSGLHDRVAGAGSIITMQAQTDPDAAADCLLSRYEFRTTPVDETSDSRKNQKERDIAFTEQRLQARPKGSAVWMDADPNARDGNREVDEVRILLNVCGEPVYRVDSPAASKLRDALHRRVVAAEGQDNAHPILSPR